MDLGFERNGDGERESFEMYRGERLWERRLSLVGSDEARGSIRCGSRSLRFLQFNIY